MPLSIPFIQVDRCEKYFGSGSSRVMALRGVSFEVKKGEVVFLFGPSGSGKSTLLNILSGLELPEKGRVVIAGQDLKRLSKAEISLFHREKVGMVFQAYNLIPSLSVEDNIVLPLVFSRVPIAERRRRADELLHEFDLTELAQRLPPEISGGQQQRVGIMRALAQKPPILIADEPTGNLDSASAKSVMEIFARLNKRLGTTLVVVTHNPEHLSYADRVLHLHDGQIIKESIHRNRVKRGIVVEGSVFARFALKHHQGTTGRAVALMPMLFSDSQLSVLTKTEVERCAQFIGQRLCGLISSGVLRSRLDQPVADGGAGLYAPTAKHAATTIEQLVKTFK